MRSEPALMFEHEAQLYEQAAEVIAGQAACVARRVDVTVAIAELKDQEAAVAQDERAASRLLSEGEAARREVETLKQIASTLRSEQRRALLQAERARSFVGSGV